MKRLTLFLTIILTYNFSYSQGDSLQGQINEQVWKPFIKSFNSASVTIATGQSRSNYGKFHVLL
jgi:hypothetical protein